MKLTHQLNWPDGKKRTSGILLSEKTKIFLEAIRSAGSRLGLLPKTIGLIDKCEHIDSIFPANCYPQINQYKHLIVFSAYSCITHDNIDELLSYVAASNNLSLHDRDDYKEALKLLVKVPNVAHFQWGTEQAHAVLEISMAMAAEENIEVVQIAEFNHEIVDQVMDLKSKGLHSILILAMGKSEDHHVINPSSTNPKIKSQSPVLAY